MSDLISGYEPTQLIKQSPRRLTLQAIQSKDQRPVVIKMIAEEFPDSADIARLHHEFVILGKLKSNNIIQCLDFIDEGKHVGLVMEFVNYHLLSELIRDKKINLRDFLSLAIQLGEAVDGLHTKGIIHRDIKPDNILVDSEKKSIKLIDFEFATELDRETSELTNLTKLKGSLAYISPEQTGRMNRPVTYSADLYSLGVTFYEMLTGELPFQEEDPMAMVYCHLAKNPRSPHEVDNNIPEVVSDMVMKLMMKKAEDRYQSAHGLAADLRQAQENLDENNQVKSFPLAQHDISYKFEIPAKLYGREQEVEKILGIFDRLCEKGESELLFISGYSGIGKTALVNEVHKPIVGKKGFFIKGKNDQYQRDQTYFALSQAFEQLIQQILAEPADVLASYEKKLTENLGKGAQAIIDIVPSLKKLLKNAPTLEELGPIEGKSRLFNLFVRFIMTFTENGKPLVLFIDDMQWSTTALIDLVEYLITSPELKHLLIIAAYRDNEVNEGHPLVIMQKELANTKKFDNILVKPLDVEHIVQMIQDTLNDSKEHAEPLAKSIFSKTEGNPFFLKSMLNDLYQRRFLYFTPETATWNYDPAQVAAAVAITTNVVEFMIKRLSTLLPETQNLLQIASCIGNNFDLSLLAKVAKQDRNLVASYLMEALKFGAITAIEGDYEVAGEFSKEHIKKTAEFQAHYRFQHDRIQQASYEMLKEEQRAQVHLDIGHALQEVYANETENEHVMSIAAHLNKAGNLIVKPEEKKALAQLNLKAAEIAKAASAYGDAYKLSNAGIHNLNPDCWETDYKTAYDLYFLNTEAGFLTGQFENSEKTIKILLENAKTNFDKAKVYMIATEQKTTEQRLFESLDLGIEGLKLLGITIDKNVSQWALFREYWLTKYNLGFRSVASLIDAPMMVDPEKLVALRILKTLSGSAYLTLNNRLFTLICLTELNFVLKYGNSAPACAAYVFGANMLASYYNDYALAYEYGKLALKLNEKLDDLSFRAGVQMLYYIWIHPFNAHLRDIPTIMRKVFANGYQAGDLIYANYAIMDTAYIPPLRPLDEEIAFDRKTLELGKMTNFNACVTLVQSQIQAKLSLKDRDNAEFFKIGSPEEEEYISQDINAGSSMGAMAYMTKQMRDYYLFREYQKAYQMSLRVEKVWLSQIGHISQDEFFFYAALVILEVYPTLSKKEAKEAWKIFKRNRKKIKTWAQHFPLNFLSQHLLIEAELLRFKRKNTKAQTLFRSSVVAAKESDYILAQATCNERAGMFFEKTGDQQSFQDYMKQAYHDYSQWGATAKVEQLQALYPTLFMSSKKSDSAGKTVDLRTTTMMDSTGQLDFTTVLKLSQTISEEVLLPKLIEKSLMTIAENIGAQYSALVLISEGALRIEGTYDVELKQVKIESRELTDEWLPSNIINYVNHSKEDLVVDDIAKKEEFSQNPYFKSGAPKSIICAPIIYHQELVGIFYGENRLVEGAFPSERLQTLHVLSGQVAISIENARFFQRMERLYKSTERFVPKQFLELLGKKSIEQVKLGDSYQLEFTAMFADLRNFTTMAEKITPVQLTSFLNTYMRYMAPIIRRNNGFVVQFLGDGILALFPSKADDAVRASIDMHAIFPEFNREISKMGFQPAIMGIAFHSGPGMLCTLGEEERLEASVVSDVVNTASRLEGLNKLYGTGVLISDATYSRLEDPSKYIIRKIDDARVKGKVHPLGIYEVYINTDPNKKSELLNYIQEFSDAIEDYKKGDFSKALEKFEAHLQAHEEDTVATLYQKRCTEFLEKGAPQPWTGITTFLEK